MNKIVQKFGGTTLDTAWKRKIAAKHIQKAIETNYFPVVVVSAMGRKGFPYATDTLVEIAKEDFINIQNREKDLLMSCGEIISSVMIVQALKALGIKGIALTGAQAGIITDDNFGETRVQKVNPKRILQSIKNEIVPVIAGFQGISDSGEITTLGRGGSDITACIIAAAIDALFIEIYTDVEGLMTADPSLVKKAKILNRASYKEVCELAYQGAKIIHPLAAEIGMNNEIPIEIKSILEGKSGTRIEKEVKRNQPVTGIASQNNIVFVKIKPEEKSDYDRGLEVFKILAHEGISVDFINTRSDEITFIVESLNREKIVNILENGKFDFTLLDGYIKVSVVGAGMTGRPGIMATIIEVLKRENISIYQSTDSHISIACLIKKEDEKRAINALHKAFRLEE